MTPNVPLLVHLAPLDTSGQDPTSCGPARPISFISAIIKVTEVVIYGAILRELEPFLQPAPDACRRGRGAELRLARLTDSLRQYLEGDRFAFFGCLEI